jgi:hypothetical protein
VVEMKTETLKLIINGTEREFVFKPLNWEHFPKLFTIASKFQNTDEKEMLSKLDEKLIKDVMELELTMFKISYPEMKEEDIKDIILQNMFELMTVLFEINLAKK